MDKFTNLFLEFFNCTCYVDLLLKCSKKVPT